MADQYGVAALRHLGTAEALEVKGRLEDAGYHYGIAGETAVKASLERAGVAINKEFWWHLDDKPNKSLLHAIQNSAQVLSLLASGRLGGGLVADLDAGVLTTRFAGWSIKIRYADTDFCPVDASNLAAWKVDAVALVYGGAF